VALATNPFVVLSYVSGPAILTSASSLLLMSTTNRFARAIDRSRVLIARALTPGAAPSPAEHAEMLDARRRVGQLATALSGLYLAAAMFGLAALLSIAGAALAETLGGLLERTLIVTAVVCGVIGFFGFVGAGILLVIESRLAMRSLLRESDEALRALNSTIKAQPPHAEDH
jgi:Protein of unknown function (DUF2721)